MVIDKTNNRLEVCQDAAQLQMLLPHLAILDLEHSNSCLAVRIQSVYMNKCMSVAIISHNARLLLCVPYQSCLGGGMWQAK